jgi:hypothetical protein
MQVNHLSIAHEGSRPEKPRVHATARTVMAAEIPNKQILDTSAWNNLIDDPGLDLIREKLRSVTIIPTALAIAEIAATEDPGRRLGLLRMIKTVGKDNRPLATPNQLIIAVCQGYARRDQTLTLNTGNDAEGAWIALNRPELADSAAQRVAVGFNKEREDVLRNFTEGLREELKAVFEREERPPSIGALLRHYAQNGDFLYEVVNPIYERAVGMSLLRCELWSLFNATPYWRMFLLGYGCAIYQRAVKPKSFGHRNNPGHLDLWSATYLPSCDVFVTADKRQRRALKILNKGNARPTSIMSYREWRGAIIR